MTQTQAPVYELELRQRVTMVQNRWDVVRVDGDGEWDLAFAQQKRFKLRERVSFVTPDEAGVAFAIEGRKLLEIAGTYDVVDGEGQVIATLGKDFRKSLTRSTYRLSAGGRDYAVVERGTVVPVIRRIVMFALRFVNVDIPWLFPIQFDVRGPDGELAATVERRPFRIRDLYELKAYDATLDWRVLAAQGVACDAFMNR